MMKRIALGIFFAFIVSAASLVGCSRNGGAVQDAALSSGPAAGFALSNLHGETVSLSDFKGQKVLLDFWATWCPPCRIELPGLNSMVPELNKSGVVVLNISVDKKIDTVKKFIADNRYSNLIVLHDDQNIADRYQVSAIPTKVLIGEDGNILARKVGSLTEEQMKDFVGL
ncbi:TlpA family protein disulfide reductase [PVC group bacterium]|nr:TlpA family protein disulfide reductase [PVC group bacterium]MCH7590846.1 TlpA family protein disulfide reductase [PVC group bacterium]